MDAAGSILSKLESSGNPFGKLKGSPGDERPIQRMKTTSHTLHSTPTRPALRVTGAAARSVAAADEVGRAAHQAVIDIQIRMLAHEQVRRDDGIDATWCAQALRLLAAHADAAERVSRLKTRWAQGVVSPVFREDDLGVISFSPLNDWRHSIKCHGDALAHAGVPPIEAILTPEAWDDAAARGC